jgi:hypothetical protein
VNQPHQPAAERRAHDSLSRRREYQLLDELSNVLGLARLGGASTVADVEGERDLRHVPLTRGCVATTLGGPWGICSALWQRPLDDWRIAGCPLTSTRNAGTSHCTFTHGCGFVPGPTGIWNGHPATVYVSFIVATGWPLTVTRVFDETVVTWPAWGQIAAAPTWKSGGT